MELSEKITALESENNNYKQVVEQLNAERVALDQLFVESLKSQINLRKQLIINESEYKKLSAEKNILFQEKENLHKNIDDLKNKFANYSNEKESF